MSAREAENRAAEDVRHAFANTRPGSNYGAYDHSRLVSIFFQAAPLLPTTYYYHLLLTNDQPVGHLTACYSLLIRLPINYYVLILPTNTTYYFLQDARLASFGPSPDEMPASSQLPSEIVFFVRTSIA